MLNAALVEQLLAQARGVEHARAAFIKSADFYQIRNVLFEAVTALEQTEDTMVALDMDTAAQVVEYIERTEELIPSLMMLISALAFGTAPPGWLINHLPIGVQQ